VTALSDAARAAFRHELGVEARVIPPGVDMERFRPGAGRAPAPTVFCAADLEQPRKRVELVVEAVRRLRAELSDARLVLARPRHHLAPSLPEWVELRDVDDEAELARTYGEASVSVLASRGEAFGLVLVESLACGTPVVAADEGGMPEIVNDDSIGVLFAEDSAEALAAALRGGLELSRTEGVVERCRARAGSFSTQRCVETFAALYAELTATTGPAVSRVEQ
jgi:phosphatidylinositol alpha-mannosyltransferase